MADSVFISYSRKDQEFVRKLAADLNGYVQGVWFDQSDIRAGEVWEKSITDGIAGCLAFILVVSPNSAASPNVRSEIQQALQNRKPILPVIYHQTALPPDLAQILQKVQYINLQHGSYADNFQYLVESLAALGVPPAPGRAVAQPGFLRQPVKTDWGAVFGRIPLWAASWAVGWGLFWIVLFFLFLLLNKGSFNAGYLLIFPIGGALGGAVGGLLAGLFTMLVLRRNAPSIAWKHMTPAIRIWLFIGSVGAVASYLLILALVKAPQASTDCPDLGSCIGQAIGQSLAYVLVLILGLILFTLIAWFVTGAIAGGLAVRSIRRLEPGIRAFSGLWISLGWGTGAVVAAIAALLIAALVGKALGIG
jgi:hypothetical protein